ncbi:hypothetical protein M3Y94_00416300 [Aphelenchoides besseyi]|nr:hypothetical protein M3Y94_00416300 [Aphelenchoides besseyi]
MSGNTDRRAAGDNRESKRGGHSSFGSHKSGSCASVDSSYQSDSTGTYFGRRSACEQQKGRPRSPASIMSFSSNKTFCSNGTQTANRGTVNGPGRRYTTRNVVDSGSNMTFVTSHVPSFPNSNFSSTNARGYVPENRPACMIFRDDEKMRVTYAKIAEEEDRDLDFQGDDVPNIIETWDAAGLNETLRRNIVAKSFYNRPRRIQRFCIPYIQEGRDLIAVSETGSGKTASFLIPLIDKVMKQLPRPKGDCDKPLVIVLEPVREVVVQVYEQAVKFSAETGVHVQRCYGEICPTVNAVNLQQGVDILIATPGRLIDFLQSSIIRCHDVKTLVIDEADCLLDLTNFGKDVKRILKLFESHGAQLDKIQYLLYSATVQGDLQQLGEGILTLQPNRIIVSNPVLNVPNPQIAEVFELCYEAQKKQRIKTFFEENSRKIDEAPYKLLAFVETRTKANSLAEYFKRQHVNCHSLDADLNQAQREETLRKFRHGAYTVIIASDMCARGLDIHELDYVLNIDMPKTIDIYINRVGRCGRLMKGFALSLIDPEKDTGILPALVKTLRDRNIAVPAFMLSKSNSTSNFGSASNFGSVSNVGSSASVGSKRTFGSKPNVGSHRNFGSNARPRPKSKPSSKPKPRNFNSTPEPSGFSTPFEPSGFSSPHKAGGLWSRISSYHHCTQTQQILYSKSFSLL